MTMDMKLSEEHEDGVIEGTIRTALSYGASESDIISRLTSDLHISEKDAEESLMEYMDRAVSNLGAGKVSSVIDLSDF